MVFLSEVGIHGEGSLCPVYRDTATTNSAPSTGSSQTDRPTAELDKLRSGSARDKKIPETWRLEVRNVLPRISSRLEERSHRVLRRVSVARRGYSKRHPNRPAGSCSLHDSRHATRFQSHPPTSLRTTLAPLYSAAGNRPRNIGSHTRCVLIHDR